MGRTVIYYNDLFADATITATTENTGYEKEYLADHTKSSLWQATANPATISIDLGAAALQSALWVGGSNMATGDTLFRYWVGDVAPAAVTSFELDMQANSFKEIMQTYRHARILFQRAAGNPEAGKVYLAGSRFELPHDFSRNYIAGYESIFIENRGRYGQINRELLYTKYSCSFEIKGMKNAQKVIMDETIRLEPYILFKDGELGKVFYGVLSLGQPEFVTSDSTGMMIWNISGTFEEAL
jgi:hypothetical protein